MTKKTLMRDLETVCAENYRLKRENQKLEHRVDELYQANLALGDEVNFLNDKIDRAVALIKAKQKARKGPPAWLREVIRDA